MLGFLPPDAVGLIINALLEASAKSTALRSPCASIVRFCDAKGGVEGCNELEWQVAAMALNQKRVGFLRGRIDQLKRENPQWKAFHNANNLSLHGVPAEEALEVVRVGDRIQRMEQMLARIANPNVPVTSPTWKDEFKRQCFELLEAYNAKKMSDAIAKANEVESEAKAADELLRQWRLDDMEEAREKRLRAWDEAWEKREAKRRR